MKKNKKGSEIKMNSQIEELRKKYEDNIISYDEIGMLFNAIDTLDIKNQENNERVLTNFLDIYNANNTKQDKIQNVLNLCMNKIKEYNEMLQLFKNDEEIINHAKIERDLAQQIYTMLF